jgi:hypothetical protein
MIEHEMSELEMILEQEQPDEPVLGEIEHPEDARYLINPELDEVTKAIEEIQQETPAEREARYRKDLDMLEVSGAIYRQKYEDKEKPVLPEIRWDL